MAYIPHPFGNFFLRESIFKWCAEMRRGEGHFLCRKMTSGLTFRTSKWPTTVVIY